MYNYLRTHSNVKSDLSNLSNDGLLWQRILNYDLSIVTKTFARRSPEYAKDADVLEMECKRFLYLASIAPNFELAPTKPIDDYWHQFILFTEKYTEFCNQFNGRFVHHKPLGAADHSVVFERTQKIVVRLFNDFNNLKLWMLPAPATSCCSAKVPETC